MTVPDYQTLMLPLLKTISDGRIFKIQNVKVSMSVAFTLTPVARKSFTLGKVDSNNFEN
jgi:restriction endonuclease Mrr